MKRKVLALVLVAIAAIPALAGPKVTDPVVRSTIADSDSQFTPYSIQSDLLGDYLNGSSSVVSRVQSIGDWELDLLASPTRRANVNFNDLVAGSNPANMPTPASGYYPVRFLTQCVYGTTLLQLTAAGQSTNCGMIVAVNIGTERYSLRFYSRNFPGSNDVTGTCTSAASGQCNSWKINSPNGDGKRIAQVYKITTDSRGRQVLTDYGKYRFSFDLSFTRV